MSANVPETMLLSDIMKSTGYNCPEELQGKTFAEATSGSDIVLEDNKAVTISQNGETVISPTSGKDAMKKVTATVSVPVPSLEDNKASEIDVSAYTEPVEVTPTSGKDGMKKATVTLSGIPDLEANKEVTVNVTEYTEPIEITATSGKDGMVKVTLTLTGL